MKRSTLSRRSKLFPPEFYEEIKLLKTLILKNWWNEGEEEYTVLSKQCKTSVANISDELAKSIHKYNSGKISEEKLYHKYRYVLDLIDYYSMQEK